LSLTEDELTVLGDAYAVWLAEQERREEKPDAECWFAVRPEFLPEATRLHNRGRLDRRITEHDVQWRLGAGQAVAQNISSLTGVEGRQN
jgi:hypothetical protein